jgi:hypothetical protein
MASKNSYPLIRGRQMRVTRLDGCGNPMVGPGNTAVTEGFVSVAATAQTTEAEAIEVTNANGKICARDPGSPEFNGYSVDITFCDVQPCVFEIMTGQKPVKDALGDTVGFKMNSSIDQSAQAFALEIWAGVPGVACSTQGGASSGYILFPYITSGTVGDFTVENAAINFAVTGAMTKDGNNWGAGPYTPVPGADGTTPARLPERLDTDDHLYVVWTPIPPPEPTDGCVELVAPTPIDITGVTAGKPGSFVPGNADLPASLAALKAHAVVGDAGTSKPTVAWLNGEYVVLGDRTHAHWNGTAWAAGASTAPVVLMASASAKPAPTSGKRS